MCGYEGGFGRTHADQICLELPWDTSQEEQAIEWCVYACLHVFFVKFSIIFQPGLFPFNNSILHLFQNYIANYFKKYSSLLNDIGYSVSYKVGTLNAKETEDASSAKLHVLYDHVPDELIAPPNSLRTKWVFLTAYGNNKEEVDMFYEEGESFCCVLRRYFEF